MISIVIPTLNEEAAIEKTLQQFSQIKNTDFELIVSDGGSTDRTRELAKKAGARVIVSDAKTRQTIAAGRNLGANNAKGEYFLFLDADVQLKNHDEFLQTLLERFAGDQQLVAATVRVKILPELASLADRLLSTMMIDWPHFINNNILQTGSASGEVMFVRKSAFEQVGGFNETLVACEDINLFERLAKIGKTRSFYDLCVYHSGRRFHQVGWAKIVYIWVENFFYYKFSGKTKSKEWTVVR